MPTTKVDQIRALNRAVSLWEDDQPDIGYMATVFAQTSLPYRDPGLTARWGRRNGRLSLTIQPGEYIDDAGKVRSIGIPYGVIPRLLLAWMSTEAKRTKTRHLVLGESLADFMEKMELAPTGGRWGTITRLREQMNRLFLASIVVRYDSSETRDAGGRVNIVDQFELWWAQGAPGQRTLMPSYVELSQKFYDEIASKAMPLKWEVLQALRRSPLRLDIYLWLTYRMATLKRPAVISWDDLRGQFGSQLANTKQGRSQFRRDFQGHLRQVLVHYPEAQVEPTPTALVLRPSPTHVRRRSGSTPVAAPRRLT
jgi:hypothetical protein